MTTDFPAPTVVCRCGRIYFQYQSEVLWECATQHYEADKRLREFVQDYNDRWEAWKKTGEKPPF